MTRPRATAAARTTSGLRPRRAKHRDHTDQVQEQQNGEHAVRELHVYRLGGATASRPQAGTVGTRPRRRQLRREPAHRDGEERDRRGGARPYATRAPIPSLRRAPRRQARRRASPSSRRVASSVMATSQCATVAYGAFPSFTVTPPRIAAANTAASAPTAERSTPPRPPTPGSRAMRHAATSDRR